MIRRWPRAVLAALPVLGCLGAGVAGSLSPDPATAAATAPTATATVVVVTRPVTATGRVAAGYRVVRDRGVTVSCHDPAAASAGAVDPNIDACYPSAAYAVACWNAARPHHVLCDRDASRHRVDLIRRSGPFGRTPPPTPAQRSPLVLVLADGTRCGLRNGGAWGPLHGHPKWYGTYSCTRHGAVWARPGMRHSGVNESQPRWTVHTGGFGRHPHFAVRNVARAYYVGTASG